MVIDEAKRLGVRKIDWQVLEWNEPAIRFYSNYQVEFDDEWLNCRLKQEHFG